MIFYKCLEKYIPCKKKNLFVIIMLIYLYDYYVVRYNINFFRLQISVKKQHTMVCKACNSHVHNTNDMTLVHLNECFNGKFNDDHCRVQNYCIVLVVKP